MSGIRDLIDETTVGVTKAAEIAGVSKSTIYKWYYYFGIGRKILGQIRIDPIKLNTIIKESKRVTTRSIKRDEFRIKSYECPFGYSFGIDFDEKPRCQKCNQVIWLHCGDKYDELMAATHYKRKSNKLHSNEEIEEMIKDMKERLG